MNSQWAFALVGGAGAYATATYAALMYQKGVKAAQKVADGCEPTCVCRERAFDGMGDSYDNSIGWDEFFMGIGWLRWSLMSRAQGQVLEVSAGTGRNVRYYGRNVTSVVFTDVSYDMLRRAKLKWEDGSRAFSAAFVLSDVLALARQVLKPGGRLLLLEHGRSTWQWLNNILDADAAQRYALWGCWWNRDILAALEGAGLQVETLARWHFGTTYYVVARAPFSRD